MTRSLDVGYRGGTSRFRLLPIDRKKLHGFKKRIALDENGNECASAHLTRDGRFLLRAGSISDLYINDKGDAVRRNELVTVDENGKPLKKFLAIEERTELLENPGELDNLLNQIVTQVHILEVETLDPELEEALFDGAIFRIPYRPRATYTDSSTFLLANEHGIFLVQAETCSFDFVGLEQTISEVEGEWDDGEDEEFDFEIDWRNDHALP